jgi:hypothetical protein
MIGILLNNSHCLSIKYHLLCYTRRQNTHLRKVNCVFTASQALQLELS